MNTARVSGFRETSRFINVASLGSLLSSDKTGAVSRAGRWSERWFCSADESGPERVGHRACAASHVELDVDIVEIALDCRQGYGKLSGDLRAGAAIGGELKDTKLSC